ncbi:MAG: L-carnitine dehydratase/bile acid-inducible protein [Acidimicrobiales bacterium]|nr:L-carnitine dehydratase/bile acid-inducible protein [Acidimicrobiales bacterium]
MLEGVRVVDLTTQIAGPYCTKLLADAGADVVKVERAGGDPLRGWGTGGLFEYLNTSKRSVAGDGRELVERADVLVIDSPVDVAQLRTNYPSLVVVTITPFGCDGPWWDRPATEFTLQASCGSTGWRGLPEEPPLSAGGRLGEWMTGTYAAIGAVAALRSAQRSGQGEHVDVSMLDCMTITMTIHASLFASFMGLRPMPGTGRTIEVPSVEPSSDGYVVFTTNSAQQFESMLLMIGRSDLLDDTDLARAHSRFKRRDEFLAAVHEYTTKRTSEELLAEAGDLRIPAGPVLNGETIPSFEQFVARGVFGPSPSGRFRQPRVPYRISGTEPRAFEPAPAAGADTGAVDWEPLPAPAQTGEWQLPLSGVRVLDCTAWWAGPAAPHVLGCLGADVIKVESAGRPDLMRFASTKPPTEDRWWEWGPIYHAANTGKRGITLDLTRPEGVEMFERLLATADVLVENYTPRVMEQFGLGWDRVHAVNPDVVMVRMPAFGLDGPWRDRTGFAQTMECITGMAWLTGFPEGPPVLVRGACDPLAGMHAVLATMLALAERDSGGGGRLVESVMVEAALNAAVEQVIEHDAGGPLLGRMGNRSPYAAPQGVYRCKGEDTWVAIAVATDEQWLALRSVLGDPEWSRDETLATSDGRRAAHDLADERLTAWTADREADEVAEQLVAAGVPAGTVVPARDVVDNPQLRHRGLFEVEDHPVTGSHQIPGLPFRFSRIERWVTRRSPTLGEHNDEVLGEVATADEVRHLRAKGVIGERVAGL